MANPSFRKITKNITTLFVLFGIGILSFAQGMARGSEQLKQDGTVSAKGNKEELSALEVQARMYRNQGVEYQRIGNFGQAMALYQKAIQIDPQYAVAYNDLGVILEANGMMDRAEECYLKSLKVDPDYPSAYSNLALLYENKRDLRKAAVYWQKRVALGPAGDPWTIKARRRMEDIRMVLGEGVTDLKEQEVIDLMKDISVEKSIFRYDDKALAKNYFARAKLSYERHDYAVAMKQAVDAQLLDPSNKNIKDFIDRLSARALSK